MLARLREWNRRRRQWNREHEAVWAGQDAPGISGLSPFQEDCESELVAVLMSEGRPLRDRTVQGTSERYIHAYVGSTAWEVYIYRNQAQLFRSGNLVINLESWDALTPKELISEFVRGVAGMLAGE